jgi:xylulokinase
MSYLGLDIGTSGCKGAIFDGEGSCIASAYQAYSVISPQAGYAELDSNEVIEKCFEVIRQAVNQASGDAVKAIGISSQGEAFTPVGENGEFLGNAMVSSDCRATDLVADWQAQFGADKLYRITGHSSSGMFSLFKLIWLKRNQPDIWAKSKAFYCFEDLMQYRLGLDPAMGWPLAGRTMLFDINEHCWNEEILDAVELDKSRLARPLPSGSIAGVLPDAIADKLGLPPGVKVVTGGHDQTICALGAGAFEAGTAMYATGTVECICPVLAEKVLSPALHKNNLCCYDYSLPGKYTTVAYSLTGGNILQWFKEEFGQLENESGNAYELLLESIPEDPTDLLALPYFTPSGTPYFDTVSKGTIMGLRMTTSRHEILKALLEAVLLEMKLNMELLAESGMEIKKLIATGGGAANSKWLQLKADVLNTPILKTDIDEAGCLGAARLACAADLNLDIEDVFALGSSLKSVEPDKRKAAIYEKKFSDYKKMYPVMKKLYQSFEH